MRPAQDFRRLHESFSYRHVRIQRCFATAQVIGEPRRSELLAISAIELDNLVLSSLRAFSISTLRGARTTGGLRIATSPSFEGEEEIAAYMLSIIEVKNFQKLNYPQKVVRKNEASLRDPRVIEKVLVACHATNLNAFQNALSVNATVFGELSTVRNFYAHRNYDTWRKVKQKAQDMGVFNLKHANDLLTTTGVGTSLTVFENWLLEAEIFFEEALK